MVTIDRRFQGMNVMIGVDPHKRGASEFSGV